jgi:hypothetical protein
VNEIQEARPDRDDRPLCLHHPNQIGYHPNPAIEICKCFGCDTVFMSPYALLLAQEDAMDRLRAELAKEQK